MKTIINETAEKIISYDWATAKNNCPDNPSMNLRFLSIAKHGKKAMQQAVKIASESMGVELELKGQEVFIA
jgi:hypothetical protein